ncbi:phage virion morphogenesis protein [Neisseria weixii]|uniref:Phage virion morphogenesis protein n=1 Tax=Neisseria weixii TaxID=1853276 RepID=A0A3N4MWQ2_9NEIS|nr:phage virion morphogenesis protein [Neisseria weixii]RPD86217.1 phage virion morphogenesis protein [Neisseria weixii]RPD87201.1 phage virion morphogenesis protein [Neisseria weixii]
MQIVIHHNLDEISGRLNRLAGTLGGGLTKPMRAIGGVVESSARRRIAETKTAPGGKRWADLAPQTVKAKKGKGGILVAHGNLLGSITHQAAEDSVIVGSVMGYAVHLQQGTRHMPARPFLGLSGQDYQDIDDLLADWLEGLIHA